jgi:hypothetical protein
VAQQNNSTAHRQRPARTQYNWNLPSTQLVREK